MFGYIAAGYTTLFCYIVFALCHYICMKRICKTCLNNVSPYSTKILVYITLSFLLLGFVFLATYTNAFIRYILIVIMVIIGVCNRHKLILFVKELINMRK